MRPLLLGIAGGTGSGKTTLATTLYTHDPGNRALIHLDDYFKKQEEVPTLAGFTNWEDPIALKFDDLYRDLLLLCGGKSITIRTKSELFNPAYNHKNPVKIPITIDPKPLIIVEGYLALYDSRVRTLLDKKVYLEMPLEISSKRRSGTKDPIGEEYFKNLLLPMHEKYVAPTREYADMVIDVATQTPDELAQLIEEELLKT